MTVGVSLWVCVVTTVVSAQATIVLSEVWTDGPVTTSLDGEWDFFPGEFIEARSQTADHRSVAAPMHIRVPAGWNIATDGDLPRYGFGSYRVLVTVPETTRVLGLWVRQISAAGRVFWNGQEVYAAGRPGTTVSTEIPGWRPQVILLPTTRRQNELVVYASNFRDVAPGITSAISIGPVQDLFARQQRSIAGSVFLTGVMAIMALFHLILFVLRRENTATLWFALFVGVVGLRGLVVDELPLIHILGQAPYTLIITASYLTYPLAIIFILRFVESLLPADIWRPAAWTAQALSAVMALTVVATPVKVFIAVAQYYHIVVLVAGGVIVATIVRALYHRRESAGLFASGIFVLAIAAVHDILRAVSIVTTPMMVPAATLLFVLIESLVLSRQHVLALRRAQEFSESLVRVNQAVTRFVPSAMLDLIGVSDVTQISLGQVAEHDMTVLFVDIRGFTRMSERLGPQDSYTFVNEFLGMTGPIVRECGGIVDKYLGDGFFALFPGGGSGAVEAGLRLRGARAAFNERYGAAFDERIEFGVGIHSGSLMLGTIGESMRMDTSAISDTVNLASRIESLTKYFQVGLAISAATYRQLHDEQHRNTRFLGKVPIRGKSESVSVFEMFDGEDPAIVQLKAETTQQFERGVISYFLEDYEDAVDAFRAVLAQYPDDTASRRYLELAEQTVSPQIGVLIGT